MSDLVQEQTGQLQLKDRNEAANFLIHDLMKELDKDYQDLQSAISKSSSVEQLENAVTIFMQKTINIQNSIANLRNTLNFLSQG